MKNFNSPKGYGRKTINAQTGGNKQLTLQTNIHLRHCFQTSIFTANRWQMYTVTITAAL